MKQQKIRLQQLRAIARYETTFKDILDAQAPSGDGNGVHILGRYFYTLDDFLAALKNIRDKDPKAADFQTYWITPMILTPKSPTPARYLKSTPRLPKSKPF